MTRVGYAFVAVNFTLHAFKPSHTLAEVPIDPVHTVAIILAGTGFALINVHLTATP